jgi:hypothetical protein
VNYSSEKRCVNYSIGGRANALAPILNERALKDSSFVIIKRQKTTKANSRIRYRKSWM